MNRWWMTVLWIACVTIPSWAAAADGARSWATSNLGELSALYRELHSHPELSFQEKGTAARLAKAWREAGFEVTTDVGGHGIVGVLKNGAGRTLLLRTDLDALPVVEQTGLACASKVKTKTADGQETGVMHACGHDVHMTCLTGSARFLAAHRERWKGTLLLVGQPAEERGAGAKAMLADRFFERFGKPDFAVALHVDSNLDAGKVGVRGGFSLANVDSVDIEVHGKGGHGAYPHTTIDPIVEAAELVLALQTIVSREIKPTEPAVVTVGSIHGGTKHNIIGDSCHLQLTLRSYSDEVRQQLLAGVRRKAEAVAAAHGAPKPTITLSEGTPALWNDEDLAARLGGVFRKALGEKSVESAEQSMGGEDFSQFGKAGIPLVMFRLGSVEARRLARYGELGQKAPSLHSALYYPDLDETLPTGIAATVAAAEELLKP